jgi:hypothetical protein
MDRRTVIMGAVALAGVATVRGRVHAGGVTPFDPKAFAAAQAAGEGIVAFVHAPW